MNRYTLEDHGAYITVEETGQRKPWLTTIRDGKPEYDLVPWWRVTVVLSETGEERSAWALGTREDAYSVGGGLVRHMRQEALRATS